jgi:hypothetical protein
MRCAVNIPELPRMHKRDENRQQLIREALAHDIADAHVNVVERAQWLWQRLAKCLTPLIGEAGFCALYGRAVRLTIPDFKSLAASGPGQSIDSLFETLRDNLMSIDSQSAGRANSALLDTFTGLLSTLIGDALTTRVLKSAWLDKSDNTNKQEMSK